MSSAAPSSEPHPLTREVVNLPGREVSCRAFAHIFRELSKKGLGPEVLVKDIPYPVEHLLDQHQRIDWVSFRNLMANVGEIWTDPELVELGRVYARSPWTRPFRVMETLRVSWGDLFRREDSRPSPGNLVATCVRTVARQVEANWFEIDVLMLDGYEPSREAFVSTTGWLEEWPRILGLGRAVGEMEEIEGGARYRIRIQHREPIWTRLRRTIGRLLNPRAVARELEETLELLDARQRDLERHVTEHARIEEALRESEGRHRRITENAHDLITELNTEGCFIYVSPNHRDQVGYGPEELLGTPAYEQVHPQDLGLVRDHFLRLLSNDTPQEVTFRARHRDGRWLWLETVGKRFRTASDETLAVLISREVTERKRAEQERQQLEVQVQQAQKLESLGVLAGGIAHDFNNLLTPILGHASRVLADLAPDSPMLESVEQIRKTTLRAAGLTGQLLAYAGESGAATRPVDLSELIREMGGLLETASSRKAELHYALADDLPAVEADPVQIRQVVMNLIPNASEAIGDNPGVIRVCTGEMKAERGYLAKSYLGAELPEGSYVYLEVSDTGCGMDKETKEKIFDPFFTTKFAGRGLGLAALLGIVRAHKGALRVESAPGLGTTFRVLFPSGGEAAQEEPVPPKRTDAWRGDGTVLMVDDEGDVREAIQWMLESTGFSVLTAEDGQSGVDLFRQRSGDITVVLLDLTMPKMSGEEAFHEIRRIRPEAPILLSSGYGERDAIRRLADQKFTGFIQKPYDRSDLIEKLRSVLQI